MFWFGKTIQQLSEAVQKNEWDSLRATKREFQRIPVFEIIDLLDRFGKSFPAFFAEALEGLNSEGNLSAEENEETLELLPELLSRENLEKRLNAEFTKPQVLDQFVKLPHATAKTRALSRGLTLHVTAGNVFLGAIDSLVMGFLTKSPSIVKVSGRNKFFPLFFAQKLRDFDREKILSDKFAILHWKGGDEEIESFFKKRVSTIVAWGGEDMISSYQRDLPPGVKFLDFGPKISLQVLSQKGLVGKDLGLIARRIVDDIVPWNQGACSSPQNLFIEEGIDARLVLEQLKIAFEKAPRRNKISQDEATEILKEKYRGFYSSFTGEGQLVEGEDFLIHLEKEELLRPSALNRTLLVKRFTTVESLSHALEPFSFYLQSCSYLVAEEEREVYLEALALAGIKRFAPLGSITRGLEGAPHDGRFVLRELVEFIGDENRVVSTQEKSWPLLSSKDLRHVFETTPHPPGYVFSSGGTTGEPKYVHFSYEEFDFMSDMLAENFRRQGVKKGMSVANLFVAGNLWSSFLCVEKALEKLGVVQLPIGGLATRENILTYLKKFKPDVVMGIPSLIVQVAEAFAKEGDELHIPMVFYAGEALSETRKDYLRKIWKTEYFGSGGYASVDGGVIGYQCSSCGPGEHHIFSNLIDLEIVNDEAVVTSLARHSMPIRRYRTGDRIEWVPQGQCQTLDKKFRLLGRIDDLIQVWSCRINLQDIEAAFSTQDVLTFQVILKEESSAKALKESMELKYEAPGDIDPGSLLVELYQRSRDLRDTLSFESFQEKVSLTRGQIARNARTGKIGLIRDLRTK
jgi:phenylacetate-CoA ligase